MRLQKSFQLALNILFHSKLRSWLTIIGIIIGIGAVVSIVSISEGASQQLEERLNSFGADVLTVSPGRSQARGAMGGFRDGPSGGGGTSQLSSSNAKNLTQRDVIVIRSIDNVKLIEGEVTARTSFTYGSKSASLSVRGVDEGVWKDITNEKLVSGRLLNKGDSYSVVIGGNIVKNTFKDGIPLNSKVIINGKAFKIVGILEGGSTVYMPIDIARATIEGIGNEKFDSISVKIADIGLVDDTVSSITKKLMTSRGILSESKMDFSVSNPTEMQATIRQTMQTMGLFLGAIAAISLLVGGIGIANTMFTSVLEKTKEIGIMKAIGAKNKDVLLIFLFNSGLIGLVGGLGGVVLGYIGSSFISYLSSSMSGSGGQFRMFGNTAISSSLIFGSLFFSVIIGMIAGAIPAYRASRLNPVDALRYE